ncbi:germination protein YpeB [Clostridiisalibacter paucivorans]|uniref:germination protein YpeB n=1 Tax=Clostridiisalibacter paucivorans TaxID=408753 RepID=UPI00047A0CC8|nr:germination protein YpeB [Clostridiisalibacter paucivorans]
MKKRNIIISSFLAFAILATGIWGYTQYRKARTYEIMLNNQYQRMFYDMKDNVETVQTSLSKALLSESKEQNVLLLSQIWQQAYFAKDKLAQLPVKHSDLAKTEKFLNQVADYSYALLQDHLDENNLDNKQRQSLFKLQDYTAYLSGELEGIHQKVLKGDIDISSLSGEKDFRKANENMINTRLAKYEEEQLTEYPELIYDGPFSDQVLNVKPKGLGDKEFTEKEAEEVAKKFIGVEKVEKITGFEQGENSDAANINAYTFSIVPENKDKESAIYIGISKMGGKPIWMENPRPVKDKKLSDKDAEKSARDFLKEKGFEGMEPNYSLKYDGSILYNFAYTKDDVTIYTDLIKVKIALDNGEIIGFDASKYLKSHYEREIDTPEITKEQARERVRYDFDISKTRLAIIPDRGNNDLLCYEFRGKYKGLDFIVYINAATGKEEKILKIIKDENGTLMI